MGNYRKDWDGPNGLEAVVSPLEKRHVIFPLPQDLIPDHIYIITYALT